MTSPTPQLDPPRSTARQPSRRMLIGGALTVAVVGVVAAVTHLPDVDQARPVQVAAAPASTSRPAVGTTAGYTITNESNAILVYQRVAGHMSAPPLAVGGAWLPGQTLNFELGTGSWDQGAYTGDALFASYAVGGPGSGSGAGSVDVHFNSDPENSQGTPSAYLNPSDTAPLHATSSFPSATSEGETWTMFSGATNQIEASADVTQSIGADWTLEGVTADQLLTSVTTAPASTCTTPSTTLTTCTLGNVTWDFSTG